MRKIRRPIATQALRCMKCGHTWVPRKLTRPWLCPHPSCHTPRWDQPRRREQKEEKTA